MRLEEIGFYTMSDARAAQASASSPLWRCEMILTDQCNFKCPYCRRRGQEMPLEQALSTLRLWVKDGLRNVRFSGGEPTLHPGLLDLVRFAKGSGVQRIALSTNGSAPQQQYLDLLDAGVNDVSVSLDACCASTASTMAGTDMPFSNVLGNIAVLAEMTHVTVGVVVTEQNAPEVGRIVDVAHAMGVADVRLIPAAQLGSQMRRVIVSEDVLGAHPILRYRIERAQAQRPVRGLEPCDRDLPCGLVLDDMLVSGDEHWPCVIYFREGGDPIGKVGPGMRVEREQWHRAHRPWDDPICRKQCLDVCVAYNRRHRENHKEKP